MTEQKKNGRVRTPARRGRPPASTRKSDRLIEVALPAFAQQGYAGTNLRQLADAAGTDVSLITHAFGSKLGLWQAVIDDISTRLIAALESSDKNPTPPADANQRLLWALTQLTDIVCDIPYLAQFIASELVHAGERFDYLHARLVAPMLQRVKPLIVEVMAEREIDDATPDLVYFGLSGSICMMAISRPFMPQFSLPATDAAFREALKRALATQLSLACGSFRPAS